MPWYGQLRESEAKAETSIIRGLPASTRMRVEPVILPEPATIQRGISHHARAHASTSIPSSSTMTA